jgi:CBS domain-containing protein
VTRVEEVMTRDVVTADLHESRDACLQKMQRRGCRHLPVLAEDRVIAMLSMRDLLRDEIEEQVEEIRHLRAYVYQTPPS